MTTESFLSLACAGVIGMLFGTALIFAGYRFFVFLLPIWGFFFGLVFGAQSMQALFGTGFLATITSWVVGFIVGSIFALLSYVFYAFAVALISGSLGYAAAVGLLTWLGLDMNILVWVIGLIAALAVAFVTIWFNLQKYVVIIATSLMGSATVFGTILLMFNPAATLLENPIRVLLSASPFLMILFLLVAGLGIFVQISTTRSWEVGVYNRMSETGV
jgi:hypothetical protein